VRFLLRDAGECVLRHTASDLDRNALSRRCMRRLARPCGGSFAVPVRLPRASACAAFSCL